MCSGIRTGSWIAFLVRCFRQNMGFAIGVEERLNVHSVSVLKCPCSNQTIKCDFNLPPRTHCSSIVFASLSNQCSSADEMVSFRDSFAFSSSFQALTLSEILARPFLRISRGFRAMEGVFFEVTPLAGDVTRRTCSLNHSQTHDQIV